MAPGGPGAPPVAMLAPLWVRDFRVFWSGQLVTNLGMWMQTFGLGWLAVELAVRDGSPHLAGVYLGLVGLARALPGLGLGLIAGALADHVDRKRLLLISQIGVGSMSLLLAIFVASDAAALAPVLAVTAIASAFASFESPARHAMLPRLVPREHLMGAIGLNQISFSGPQVIGPALGALLIVPLGTAGLFVVTAATSLAVIAALRAMGPYPPSSEQRIGSVLGRVLEGAQYMRADPVIRWVILLGLVTALCARPFVFLLPAFASSILRAGPLELGWLMSATGVGALMGALVLGDLGRVQQRGVLLTAAGIALGAAPTVFALQHHLAAAVIVALVVGVAGSAYTGVANTIIQDNTHEHMLGRVMSVISIMWLGIIPLGQLVLGAGGTLVGIDTALFAGGVVSVIAAIVVYTRVEAVRDLRASRRPHFHAT